MNDNIYLLIILLFAHWIGDFVFQTRRIAENKGKSIDVLLEHVFIYSYTLFMGLTGYYIVIRLFSGTDCPINFEYVLYFIITNFALHLYIDSQTSQITTYFHKKDNMHGFFSTIGFDQFLHAASLIWTANLFLNI